VPRRLREEVEGGVFHVYARGNEKRVIFADDVDRRAYLRMLRSAVEDHGWRLLAYCLMENHVHLLIETPRANLGAGMQWLHGTYAGCFNKRHDRSGHLFQGRYGAKRIKTDAQLWATVAYIAMNPVEAELCRLPEDWPWSSHPMALGGTAPDWIDVGHLLEYFAAAGGDGRRRYAELFLIKGSDPLEGG
jgi:REP element-mobilizing transposase RayT